MTYEGPPNGGTTDASKSAAEYTANGQARGEMVHDHFLTFERASRRQSETGSSSLRLPREAEIFAVAAISQAHIGRKLGVSHQTVSDGMEKRRNRGTAGGGSGRAATEAGHPPARRCRGRAREGPEGEGLWHRVVDAGPGGPRGDQRCQLSPRARLADPSRTARLDPPAAGTLGDRARRRGDRAKGDGAVAEGVPGAGAR